MFRLLSFIVFLLSPVSVCAWEVFSEKSEDGALLHIAEQVGEGGGFLNLVCLNGEIHIEIIAPAAVEGGDAALLLQVDGHPESLVAGVFETIDHNTSVFIGLDRRDKPSVATPRLINQMVTGKELFIGDPDVGEAFDRWSLSGSSRAIKAIRKNC